eukprot:TRINITY_DN44936_c0_g1_i1.p1 TRINITY_DN44936_c0_g1~~TRINITY_DN44936_c0_g1_i1.p1  ORF type:complete len:154 (-),score=26.06 TRINITY_DN44936_c0_g1_i1:1711-2172(-)
MLPKRQRPVLKRRSSRRAKQTGWPKIRIQSRPITSVSRNPARCWFRTGPTIMARFDVYALNRAEVPYVLEVQADLLSDLASVVVVPLVPAEAARAETMRKLKPVITIKGQDFGLMTTDIGTLRRASLGKPMVNVEEQYRAVIVDALDLLFQGF